ncbi:MAG: RNA polymerase sigma factor [Bacteroidota bacterium]
MTQMKKLSEPELKYAATQELIRKSCEGDLAAFRSLMESHQRYAYAVALPLLRDEERARDVVQEAFIRVWNNLRGYRPEVKFTTWLYKIVINLCYDSMKMETRRKNIFSRIANLFEGGDPPAHRSVHEEAENADLCGHILAEAKKLPAKERLVFHLRDVEDFSIEEIAEMAGISIASVKTNLCYARKKIRVAVTQLKESELL